MKSSERSEFFPASVTWRPVTLPLAAPIPGRVAIWKVRLDAAALHDPANSLLSPDEITRVNRFHFEKDRAQFVCCRSALRKLLGEYLGISPEKVRFKYLASGKPQLERDQNPLDLQFNVAHSGDVALLAFGAGHRLGVDVEKIRGDVDTQALAERFFSLREREELRALPGPMRVSGFFTCWARKEAFLKATGDGLSFPLSKFSVSIHPDRRPEVEEIDGSEQAGKQWFVTDLPVDTDYRAALAADQPHLSVDTFAFPWKSAA
jgi:4'-phosphopantetheinyl transferase